MINLDDLKKKWEAIVYSGLKNDTMTTALEEHIKNIKNECRPYIDQPLKTQFCNSFVKNIHDVILKNLLKKGSDKD